MTEAIRDRAKTIMLNDPSIINEENVIDLERGIFNWSVDYCENCFEQVYNEKFKSVMINMRNNDNMRDKFNKKDILGREFANFQPYDWNPESWKETLFERQRRRTAAGVVQQNTTDLFQCGKCKQRNTSYYELQIRSADESATIFITCLNPKCKNQWRIG